MHARSGRRSFEVEDVAPTIGWAGDATVPVGTLYRLTVGPVTDPGSDTVTEGIVDWGDGSREVFAGSGEKTHLYAAGGLSRTVVVDLRNEDGLHPHAARLEVFVTDLSVPPRIHGPGSTIEGSAYRLDLVAGDRSGIWEWVVDGGRTG